MKAEGYKERKEQLAGWPVKIISYKLGPTYYVSIHNEEPGAWITKQEGPTLEEAESKACRRASEFLAKTRRNILPK